jgi:hypothetical protein
MSAREKLRQCFPTLPPGESNDLIEAAVDEILAKHAHELAEAIRLETLRLRSDGVLEPDKFRSCRDAADQIDPKVAS